VFGNYGFLKKNQSLSYLNHLVERDLQVLGVRRWRELLIDREKTERYTYCSTGHSPQRAVAPMEEESHKRQFLKKKDGGHEMCVLILSTNFVRNISYFKNKSARYSHKCA
jgi:hypothetical protein